jgi:hypothetical protein
MISVRPFSDVSTSQGDPGKTRNWDARFRNWIGPVRPDARPQRQTGQWSFTVSAVSLVMGTGI